MPTPHLSPLSLMPSPRRGLNHKATETDYRAAFAKLEASLSLLGVSECSCCHKPVLEHQITFGVCVDCWLECGDLADHVDFSQVCAHDVGAEWNNLAWTRYFSGESFGATVGCEPWEWRKAWSMLCVFGAEKITTGLVTCARGTLFRDPSVLRFEPGVGLVPFTWRAETEPRRPHEWRDFWTAEMVALRQKGARP